MKSKVQQTLGADLIFLIPAWKSSRRERGKKKSHMRHISCHSATCVVDSWKGHWDDLEATLESRFWPPNSTARAVWKRLTLFTQFFFFLIFLFTKLTYYLQGHPITTQWPHVNDKRAPKSKTIVFNFQR